MTPPRRRAGDGSPHVAGHQPACRGFRLAGPAIRTTAGRRRQGSARPGAAGAGDVGSGVLDRRARRLVRRERQDAHADRTGTDQYGSRGSGARPRLSRLRRSPQSPLHGKPELGRGAFRRHPAEVERHDAGCARRRPVARCRTRRGPHARPAERRSVAAATRARLSRRDRERPRVRRGAVAISSCAMAMRLRKTCW